MPTENSGGTAAARSILGTLELFMTNGIQGQLLHCFRPLPGIHLRSLPGLRSSSLLATRFSPNAWSWPPAQDTIQIREFHLPSQAFPFELIADFLHCDPLRRVRCGTAERRPLAFCHPGSGPANPSKNGCNWVGTTGTGIAALEGTPFVLGQSAPDSGVLAGFHGPAQTGLNHLAATADSLGFLCLDKGGTGVPDWEEQLGVQA